MYFVYTKQGPFTSPIKIADLTESEGFALFGDNSGDAIGQIVIPIEDVNGDGTKEIGTGSDTNNAFHVLFGSEGKRVDLNVSELDGKNGFTVVGPQINPGEGTGFVCSMSSGKINADVLGDVIFGACAASPEGRDSAGQSWVLYGHEGPWDKKVYVDHLNGTNGFTMKGAQAGSFSGSSVKAVGDYNLDGANDVAVSAPGANKGNISQVGKVYVLFGKKRAITTTPPENEQPIAAIVVPILASLALMGTFGAIVLVRKIKEIKSRTNQDAPEEGTALIRL